MSTSPVSTRSPYAVLVILAGILVSMVAALFTLDIGGVHTATPHTVTVHADYAQYASADEAVRSADLVATGTYLSSYETLLYPTIDTEAGDGRTNPQHGLDDTDIPVAELAVPITISRVRVDSVIKGSALVGEVIEVSQPGGTINGSRVREADTILLSDLATQGAVSSLLMVLRHHPDGLYDGLNQVEGIRLLAPDGRVLPLGKQQRNTPNEDARTLQDYIESADPGAQ